ncbi:hypothetical protein TcWFU_007548 [Taenia crassiceps]|uniref:Uncharacterized protein n=1 Tax=Taenia crassiceps TaxID=6207 RepID=A0ABR4QC20_9CEST
MLTFNIEELARMKAKYEARSKNWIKLDEDCLRWSPLTDTKNMKTSPDDGGSHSSRLASPRTCPSSPKAVSPCSSMRVSAAAASSLPPPNSSAPSATMVPPKRRRGRPPRKTFHLTSLSTSAAASPTLHSPNNTGSTLLEAFPLPALDVVDPTVCTSDDRVGAVVVEEKGEEVVVTPKPDLPSPKPPSCKKDGLLFTSQRPPDSPPSASSMSTSASTGVNATAAASSATNSNTKVSTANGGGGRAPSRGKGRDSVDSSIASGSSKRLTGRRLDRRSSASMGCRDIRIFGFSNNGSGHDAAVGEVSW